MTAPAPPEAGAGGSSTFSPRAGGPNLRRKRTSAGGGCGAEGYLSVNGLRQSFAAALMALDAVARAR